jgi:hypothetical protein
MSVMHGENYYYRCRRGDLLKEDVKSPWAYVMAGERK